MNQVMERCLIIKNPSIIWQIGKYCFTEYEYDLGTLVDGVQREVSEF